jgi:Peptidase family M1 domain
MNGISRAGARGAFSCGALVFSALQVGFVPSCTPHPPAPSALATPSAPGQLGTLVEHADDIVDYTLRARLDPAAHYLHGEGTIRWRNASARPVRELWLHLYLNAFKNERSAFFRERVGGRGSAPPEDWGWIDLRKLALRDGNGGTADLLPTIELRRRGDDDETDARVALPGDVAPGQSIVLEVAFDDKLPALVERTGYRGRFHMVAQWFPKVARLESDGTWAHFPLHHLSEFYADFGTYDVSIDVPDGYTIGATGPLVESRVAGGRRIERHVQGDVHDFAWTAWDEWQTTKETIDGVEVRVLFPPGFAGLAQRELSAIGFALPYDSARYGRYPYSVLTVVHPQQDAGEAGGMEYPTLITTGGSWLTPPGLLAPEIVTVHELGHQWFYGLVATNESLWPFLDEGLNQFAEVDAMAKWRGDGSALDMMGLRVNDASLQAVGGNRAVHDAPVAQPASAFASGASYGGLVYLRTAAVLETLARVYGDDAVGRALGVYTRQQRFRHPEPAQLLDVFEQVMGARVAATLRAALFEKGWVDYVVDGVTSERARAAAGVFDKNGKRETAIGENEGDWEGTVLVRRRGTLSFPVDVELVLEDGTTRRERWDGDGIEGEWKRIAWRGPVALRGAVVDPDDRVMIDANLENNHGSASGDGGGAPRTLDRLVYWMQLAVQAASP